MDPENIEDFCQYDPIVKKRRRKCSSPDIALTVKGVGGICRSCKKLYTIEWYHEKLGNQQPGCICNYCRDKRGEVRLLTSDGVTLLIPTEVPKVPVDPQKLVRQNVVVSVKRDGVLIEKDPADISIDNFAEHFGFRFRMTKDQKARAISREEALTEWIERNSR